MILALNGLKIGDMPKNQQTKPTQKKDRWIGLVCFGFMAYQPF